MATDLDNNVYLQFKKSETFNKNRALNRHGKEINHHQ